MGLNGPDHPLSLTERDGCFEPSLSRRYEVSSYTTHGSCSEIGENVCVSGNLMQKVHDEKNKSQGRNQPKVREETGGDHNGGRNV